MRFILTLLLMPVVFADDSIHDLFGRNDNHAKMEVNGTEYRVIMLSAEWCGACRRAKLQLVPKLREEIEVKVLDVDTLSQEQKEGLLGLPARYFIPRYTLQKRESGKDWVSVLRRGTSTKNGVISGDQKYVHWSGSGMSVGNLRKEIESRRDSGKTRVVSVPWETSKEKRSSPRSQQSAGGLRVTWNGKQYNPKAYGRCSWAGCAMCAHITNPANWFRIQSTSIVKQQTKSPEKSAAQANAPIDIRNRALAILRLTEDDVLVDLGCGDASVLIDAVKTYGCSAVGVEIDAQKASEAISRVRRAGLSEKIQILTMDARDFNPLRYEITAAYVYLYPDLLEDLKGTLDRCGRTVSVFHAVPDYNMTKHGDVYFKNRSDHSVW